MPKKTMRVWVTCDGVLMWKFSFPVPCFRVVTKGETK